MSSTGTPAYMFAVPKEPAVRSASSFGFRRSIVFIDLAFLAGIVALAISIAWLLITSIEAVRAGAAIPTGNILVGLLVLCVLLSVCRAFRVVTQRILVDIRNVYETITAGQHRDSIAAMCHYSMQLLIEPETHRKKVSDIELYRILSDQEVITRDILLMKDYADTPIQIRDRRDNKLYIIAVAQKLLKGDYGFLDAAKREVEVEFVAALHRAQEQHKKESVALQDLLAVR